MVRGVHRQAVGVCGVSQSLSTHSHTIGAEQLEQWAASDVEDQTFHPVGAFVEGECVGASATLSFQVTMPGGTTMSMAGVTATGVIATHRRQGHLRRMMQVMFDGALERGEPLAMLRTGCTIVWAVSHTRQNVPPGPPPTSGPDISISLTLPPSALVALDAIEHDLPFTFQRAGRTAEGARHYGISTHAHTRLNHNLTNLTIRISCCIWDSGPPPPSLHLLFCSIP